MPKTRSKNFKFPFSPNFSILLVLGVILIAAFNFWLSVDILPRIDNDIRLTYLIVGSVIVVFLLFSYLTFIVFTSLIAFLFRKNFQKITIFTQRLAEGNLDEEINTKLPLEFGTVAIALEILRKNVRDRLISSEEAKDRAEAILTNVGEGVFAVNLKGEVIIFNKMAQMIVGFTENQIVGQRYDQVLQFFNNKTKVSLGAFIDKVLLEGKNVGLPADTVLITANKAEIPVAVNSSPIRNQKGIIVGGIVVFRDITHEKEIEEIRTDLISIASHQLRTPLSEIRGLLSLLTDNIAGPLNPRQKEYLDLLNVANERMINLVNDLLNISRIEQGRIQLNFKAVNLGQITVEVCRLLSIRAKEHNQTFSISVDPNLPLVTADSDKTKEIISNLVENALKYTFDNGTIFVRVTATSDGVWVLVKDSGVGIPQSKQKDLFQKFSRIENPLSKMTTGTGLGLYAVKQLVDRQNGKLWFESAEGKGSTFGFLLPKAK